MISLDQLLTGLVYLGSIFVLFLVGKLVYDKLHPSFVLREELFERDNVALSLAVVGYYMGLVLALGGVLAGPSLGLTEDLIDIFFYGLLSIVLLQISAWLNDKVILSRFDNKKEIITDRNAGTGAIEGGNHVANGLIIAGAVSGYGDLVTALAFWGLGQVVLIVAGLLYSRMVSFDVHDEIERDNVAVGVAFSGVLIAIGHVVGVAVEGDFIGWSENLAQLATYAAVGLVLLPVVRLVTDKLLLPGVKLNDELVAQDEPNVGAGLIEAFSYVAAALLIGWAF
ncbi:MAG: DUF350 domain-containing protein [bacterium]|nr:DUF350 domain-containing protein [bacterium]